MYSVSMHAIVRAIHTSHHVYKFTAREQICILDRFGQNPCKFATQCLLNIRGDHQAATVFAPRNRRLSAETGLLVSAAAPSSDLLQDHVSRRRRRIQQSRQGAAGSRKGGEGW